jgi:plasmid stabilization system protein ParE
MVAVILSEAEEELETAFDYYPVKRDGLGTQLLEEFSAGMERILEYPRAWQRMDNTYRRYRLHRFPYGIIYRLDMRTTQVVVVALMHLSRRPGLWRNRRAQ